MTHNLNTTQESMMDDVELDSDNNLNSTDSNPSINYTKNI